MKGAMAAIQHPLPHPSSTSLLLLLLSVVSCLAVGATSASRASAAAGTSERRLSNTICDELYPGFCGPSIVIAGAAKCGTNALAAYLRQYPGLSFQSKAGREKAAATRGWAGEVNWPWASVEPTPENMREYALNFDATDGRRTMSVDKSTVYLGRGASAAKAMHSVLPRARILVILCDPVHRTWSAFNQWRIKIHEDRDLKRKGAYRQLWDCPLMQKNASEAFAAALHDLRRGISQTHSSPTSPTSAKGSSSSSSSSSSTAAGRAFDPISSPLCRGRGFSDCSVCGYLRGSWYAVPLGEWAQVYAGQLHVVLEEELREQPLEVMAGVVRFLGWDPARYPNRTLGTIHSNKGYSDYYVAHEHMPPAVLATLRDVLAPMYERLHFQLRRDLSVWGWHGPGG